MHKILEENGVVLFSDLHVKELKQLDFSGEEIKCIFSMVVPNNLRHVHIYREEVIEARQIASQRRIPLGDAIHAVIARDNDSILVSRDTDFEKIRSIKPSRKPEELC
ncbi:PIN domain-containing protein [Candidatus Woesearchaeota archaeon]|nr:PIN domain-containing protein [Candidatus Woesearchaeota archaeon]